MNPLNGQRHATGPPVSESAPGSPEAPVGQPAARPVEVVRVGPDRVLAAAERLVGPGAGPRAPAARRFIEAAGQFGIDLSLLWAVPDPTGRGFQQACLAVIGSGRTAMLFVSSEEEPIRPRRGGGSGSSECEVAAFALRQRVALVTAACRHLRTVPAPGCDGCPAPGAEPAVTLAQSLLEPEETAAIASLSAAGFRRLGDLAYMHRNIPRHAPARGLSVPVWPDGMAVRRLSEIPAREHSPLLLRALERSYIDTLDCPELCGMRRVQDVLDSHRSVGKFDPALWWVAFQSDQAEGCMLLTPCPEQHAVELVYLGLSPPLRGCGLAASLLKMGIAELAGRREHTLTCAVDLRNTPALKLYERAGFERAAVRVPMVLPLAGDERPHESG
jgi:mycothiol synthase